jgi:branched-subunit amino acid aminotransferase/4-amino-4-deoxychorismate lyase
MVMVRLYETVLVDEGRIRLLDRHLRRLARGGTPPALVDRAAELFETERDRAEVPTVVRVDVDVPRDLVFATTRAPTPPTPVRLATVTGYDPDDRLRERKRADRAWAEEPERLARAVGADEALLVSANGLVGETTRANVFAILADSRVATPPVRGILPGVTREFALRESAAIERRLTVGDLRRARAVFLTTAGRGIVAVEAIDDAPCRERPLVRKLQEAWRAL